MDESRGAPEQKQRRCFFLLLQSCSTGGPPCGTGLPPPPSLQPMTNWKGGENTFFFPRPIGRRRGASRRKRRGSIRREKVAPYHQKTRGSFPSLQCRRRETKSPSPEGGSHFQKVKGGRTWASKEKRHLGAPSPASPQKKVVWEAIVVVGKGGSYNRFPWREDREEPEREGHSSALLLQGWTNEEDRSSICREKKTKFESSTWMEKSASVLGNTILLSVGVFGPTGLSLGRAQLPHMNEVHVTAP